METIDDTFTAWTRFWTNKLAVHRVIDLVAASQRREAAEVIERVLRDGLGRTANVTLLSKSGEEIEGALALAPILTDYTAHGACALFFPFANVGSTQRAAWDRTGTGLTSSAASPVSCGRGMHGAHARG